MSERRLFLFVLGLAVACGSAGDTSTVDVRMRAHGSPATNGGLATEDSGDNPVDIHTAQARVRDIEFYLADDIDCDEIEGLLDDDVDCEDDEKLTIEGPFDVDLIEGTSNPSLEGLSLPEAVYDRVDVRVKDEDDDPAFEAEVEVDGDEMLISLEFSEDARFEDDDGVELSPDVEAVVLALDVDEWLDNVPLANCVDDEDSCSELENEIKDNIKDSGRLLTE